MRKRRWICASPRLVFAISLSFRTFRRARTKLPAPYEYDFVKADHDAKRAAHYDELLN